LRQLAGYYEERVERLLAILGLPEFDFLALPVDSEAPSGTELSSDDLVDLSVEERQELVNYLGYLRFRRNQRRATEILTSGGTPES
jgi:hypothetical protein